MSLQQACLSVCFSTVSISHRFVSTFFLSCSVAIFLFCRFSDLYPDSIVPGWKCLSHGIFGSQFVSPCSNLKVNHNYFAELVGIESDPFMANSLKKAAKTSRKHEIFGDLQVGRRPTWILSSRAAPRSARLTQTLNIKSCNTVTHIVHIKSLQQSTALK